MNIISMLEEFHIMSNQVLEKEGTISKYIYLVISGKINLHKKVKIIAHKNEATEGDNKAIGIADDIS